MSRASDELEQYKDGDITLVQLASLWADRKWKTPADMPDKTIESIELHAEDKMLGGEGTWDEVETFWLIGELSREDYNFISEFVDRKVGRASNS